MRWLGDLLKGGPMPVRGVHKKGAEAGHSRRALDEARRRMEVRTWKHVDSTGLHRYVMGLAEEKAGEEEEGLGSGE